MIPSGKAVNPDAEPPVESIEYAVPGHPTWKGYHYLGGVWVSLPPEGDLTVDGYGTIGPQGAVESLRFYRVSNGTYFAQAETVEQAKSDLAAHIDGIERRVIAAQEQHRRESDPAYIRHKNAVARAAREHTRWLADMRELYDDFDCPTISCTKCGSELIGMAGQNKVSLRTTSQRLGWTKSSGRCPRCTYR